LLGRRPDVMVSLYAEPAFICGWVIAKLRGVKTGFRVLMTHDRWITRHPFKEALKRVLFRRVDAIETPGEEGKAFALRYGVPADRVFIASHTVDIAHFKDAVLVKGSVRDALRRELGLEGVTFLYVGRLWWGKGVHHLLDAFASVQHRCAEPVSLLLVGDGVEEAQLRRACAERNISNVVFAGFQQRTALPRYYALADVLVFPTLGDPYGLVVDEAMACGLPVISTSAAGEIHDRIEQGRNGYIVPPEDTAALTEPMLHLARHPEMRTRMGQLSIEKIQGHTPEKWAEDFERMALDLLAI
jgi:glycosyltransferase involved in cell wall biosynthesis